MKYNKELTNDLIAKMIEDGRITSDEVTQLESTPEPTEVLEVELFASLVGISMPIIKEFNKEMDDLTREDMEAHNRWKLPAHKYLLFKVREIKVAGNRTALTPAMQKVSTIIERFDMTEASLAAIFVGAWRRKVIEL